MSQNSQKPLNQKQMGTLFGKGLLMGGADVIPGVSGGTVALIVGVYERFINAIKLWTPTTVLALLQSIQGLWQAGPARDRFRAALQAVDFFFIAPLGLGIASAIVVASKFIPHLLHTYPHQMNGFFFGLILISLWVPFSLLEKKGPLQWLSICGFAVLAFNLVGLQNAATPHSLMTTFFAGAIAICAMILPGVSGSFLLKAMGQYEYILTNLHDALGLNPTAALTVVCFLLGIVVGITSFARVLSWLLQNRPALTFSGLVGLMLGALRSVWPFLDNQTRWPALPQQWGSTEIQSLLAMLLGMIVVGILLYVSQRAEKRVHSHGELS
jgi:putative membrane protein